MPYQGQIRFSWKQFGADLQKTRKARGYGLRECARLLNLNAAHLLYIERGRATAAPYFIYICEWMNKDPLTYSVCHPGKQKSSANSMDRRKKK